MPTGVVSKVAGGDCKNLSEWGFGPKWKTRETDIAYYCGLEQCCLSFNAHTNHQGILLKMLILNEGPGWGLRL